MPLVAKVNFKCLICGCDDFFTMPVGKMTKSGDIVRTLEEYHVVCKKCLKSYILDFDIRAV